MLNIVKNKKGILMPETLKILIAVLALAIVLIPLAFKLYGIFIKDTKLEQAKVSLDEVLNRLDFMEKSNNEEGLIMLNSPKDWYLLGLEDGKNQLCICKNLGRDDNEQRKFCNENGVCKDVSQNILIDSFEEENYIDGVKFKAKREAIKIEITQLEIRKDRDIFYLSKSVEEAELSDVLREFLSKEVDILEMDKTKLKDVTPKTFLQILNVEDLIKVLCINPANWYVNGNRLTPYNNDLQKQIDSFFSNKISDNDFVSFGFMRKLNTNPDLLKCGSSHRNSYFRYPLKSASCQKDSQKGSQVYRTIQLNEGKYCIVYLTSTKSDFN